MGPFLRVSIIRCHPVSDALFCFQIQYRHDFVASDLKTLSAELLSHFPATQALAFFKTSFSMRSILFSLRRR